MKRFGFTPLEISPKQRDIAKSLTGFTYLEIILALVILAIALTPLLSQFYIGFKGNRIGNLKTIAANLAEELMDEIKSKRFDENEYPDPATAEGSLGRDAGETDRNQFDDVDDYHNYQESPPLSLDGTELLEFSGFSRSVEVYYASVDAGGNWARLNNPPTEERKYKMITVKAAHQEIADIDLVTVVASY